MNTHATKTQGNKSQSVANKASYQHSGAESTFQFIDNRPEATAQRKLQEIADHSHQVEQTIQKKSLADASIHTSSSAVIQCYPSYQTFQDQNMNTYCSPNMLNNHAEGVAWVRAAIAALRVRARGRPHESANQPAGAIIGPPWPAPAAAAPAPAAAAPAAAAPARRRGRRR